MKLLRILRNNSGSILPETAGSIIILSLLMAVCLSALGALILKMELDPAATDIKRMIEVDGRYDTAEQQKISTFLSNMHLSVNVNVSPADNEYNLGDSFTVTLTASVNLGAGGLKNLPLPIYGEAEGTCEVYQKE
jgi:hypothetical protein